MRAQMYTDYIVENKCHFIKKVIDLSDIQT